MKAIRRVLVLIVSASSVLALGPWTEPVEVAAAIPSRSHCVGPADRCYHTLQAAVEAARDGDRLVLSPGLFSGGITIRKSIEIVGSGAQSTIIRGGGPVVTIGRFDAPRQPTVSIQGVTIKGGVTRSSALSVALTGRTGVFALGGGVEIPPAAHFGDGATVSIRDSVIAGNRAEPTASVPSRLSCGDHCPFALAGGGGIDNWGSLTLSNTSVSDNATGGPIASDSVGSGIYSEQGHLTLVHSSVTANRASVRQPNGRFAEGGGIVALSRPFYVNANRSAGTLRIVGSRVSSNRVTLSTAFPANIEAHAHSGGILIGGDDDCSRPDSGCVKARITGTSVAKNRVSARNATGDAVAFAGGVNNDGTLALQCSSITRNRVSARIPAGSTAGASGDSGGLGMGGYATIKRSYIAGNTVTATAPRGQAAATFGGLSVGNPSQRTAVIRSVIAKNRLTATTRSGTATVQGAGIGRLSGPLLIKRTVIKGNKGYARGGSNLAQGGGIANLVEGTAPLTLKRSFIVHNSVTATDSTRAQGGGLYTTVPVVRSDTVLARNRPDQCSGSCS